MSSQFHTVHDDDFTSIRRKRVDILPPDWNQLFQCHDKVPENELINTPITATIVNDGNFKLLRAKVRFDDEKVTRPTTEITETDLISVDLETESSETVENSHEENDVSNSTTSSLINDEKNHVNTSRFGRKMCKPSTCANYFILLSGIITPQFVSFKEDHYEVNKNKHLSFFKAQMYHISTIEALPEGTSNSFEPLAFYFEQRNNNELHFGQDMKVHYSEDFKRAMKKELNYFHEEKLYEILPTSENPKHKELTRFV